MVWQYDPYAFPLFLSAAVNWGLAVFMWSRRRVRGGFAFMLLLLAAGEWSFSAAGKSLAVDLYSSVLWDKAAYLGLVSVAVLWIVFVLQYTGRGSWLRRRNMLLLSIVPILTVLLAWTNEAHHLIYSAYRMVSFGSLSMSEVTYGAWFYFLVAYSYLLVFLGVALLLQLGLRSPGSLRRQSVVLVVGALVPLVGDAVNVIGYHYPADLAPLTFCFTGILGFWVVFRLQLLKIMPVAREAVFRGMGDGVIVIDAGGRVVDINPAGEEFLGCKGAEVTGEFATVFFRSLGIEESLLEDVSSETVLIRGGVQRYFDVRSSHLTDRRGDSIGQIVVLRDITERKHLEDSLHHSEARVRGVLAALPDLVFELNSDGVFLDYFAATPTDLGYRPEMFLGKSVREILPSQLANALEAAMKAAKKTGLVQTIEYQLGTLSGTTADWEARIAPTSTGNFVDVVRNVSERKRLEDELKRYSTNLEELVEERTRKLAESENRFRELADLLPQTVFEIDQRGYFTFVNRSGLATAGYTDDDIARGVNALEVFAETDRDRVKMNIGKVLAGEVVGSTEYVARRKDGSTFPVLIVSTRIMRGGRPAGLRGIVIDITERKQTEERLLKAERLAAIGETAAMVGHDLRNPLQVISTATYLLEKNLSSAATQQTKEMLEAIENSVHYSDRIVSDLLEYSQELRLEFSETTLKSLASAAISQVKIPNNITVLDSTPDDLKMRADVVRVKRAFVNLIENAIDAMPNGGELRISSNLSKGCVEAKFTDTGQGIHEDVLKQLWKPLVTRKPKGIGLGLAICKRIAEAHGGSISVESRVGQGTTFTLTIPLAPPQTSQTGDKGR